MNNLLQITETPESLTWFELLSKGGVIMIPIFLLSLAAHFMFLLNATSFYPKPQGISASLWPILNRPCRQVILLSAKSFAKVEASSTGVIILSGLNSIGKPTRDIESTLESSTNIQIAEMENHTGYLGIIAGVAPMLGFIGTISGIIQIFYNISLSDNISIGIIAGGLYEKMITSGSGLVVGVLAYSAYHLLHLKIHRFTLQIQKDVFDFLHAITNPGKN
jgi:biopolymer transport protein ExbB